MNFCITFTFQNIYNFAYEVKNVNFNKGLLFIKNRAVLIHNSTRKDKV